jgi:hypothetical protein
MYLQFRLRPERLDSDDIPNRLNEASDILEELHKRRILQYALVAKAINQCGRDIDSHLMQFSVDSSIPTMVMN